MTDETADKAESTAQALATIWRLSEVLNLGIDDAAVIYLKIGDALAAALVKKKRAQ